MKRAPLSILYLLSSILVSSSQPSGPVTQSASGTTSAVVYFEPGARPAPVSAIDVTSDKAASVLSFQAGTGGRYAAILAAANNVKQVHLSGSGCASNDLLLAVSGSSVFPLLVTNVVAITNTTLTLENPIGTNVAVGGIVRELTGAYLTITNDVAALANQFPVSATTGLGTNLVVLLRYGGLDRWITNIVSTVISNVIAFATTNAAAFPVNSRVYLLTTNLYTASVPAVNTAAELTLTAASGLTNGDTILYSPATGGHFVRQVSTYTPLIYQQVNISANTGTALAAGDVVYRVGTTNTTPVGATTLRLAPTAWVLPQAAPARFVLDGTGACAINAITVNYGN